MSPPSSTPMDISSPPSSPRPVPGISGSPSPAPIHFSGTPDLRALRAGYAGTPPLPNIPPRSSAGTPRLGYASIGRTGSPALSHKPSGLPSTPRVSPGIAGFSASPPNPISVGGLSASRPGVTDSPAPSEPPNLDDLPDEEKAKILRKHLVSREERQRQQGDDETSVTAGPSNGKGKDNGSDFETSRRSSMALRREDTNPFPVPYEAPGADVTHDIYKWHADRRRQAARPRAASFAGSSTAPDPAFQRIHEPGGFRRNYVLLKADQDGVEHPRIIRSFIDFLYVFGHFAGEDLEEEDEEEEEEEDEEILPGTHRPKFGPSIEQRIEDGTLVATRIEPEALTKAVHEHTPLLDHGKRASRRSRSRRRLSGAESHGDASVTEAVLMLLKSFVGTGVLFLGKAFMNGGILFSTIVIVVIALISLYSFLLLVRTKFVVPGSFGDIGGELYGPWLRYAILTSIVISQLGFVAAYTIFVSENLQAFVLAVSKCSTLIPVPYFILMQLIIFLPLALIRNLAKLSTTALIADAFIVAGLVYIFGSEGAIIAKQGVAKVEMFNPRDFPLFIGTAVFSFEGIGLVIPITDAMKEPHKFPAVLTGVMLGLMVLFGGSGILAYATFGANIQTVVIKNLDSESKLVQAVQFLYSLAILLSVPLQLFPAVRIMENGLFTSSGKADMKVKWQKNIFRFLVVMFCTVVSWLGASDLDKFVAFIGSFACVPLCYVYPAMLHYKIARTRKQRIADITLMIFGLVAAVYTTVQTIRLMVAPEDGGSSPGSCEGTPAGGGR
ncbi:hypothetical protein JAAARDRAFT_35689 [Jaapia argillacea MUCL 33604]|uniref:Amino acid transporter transmembrane domain-containing protein n=1 Tax=Jaapia argillacea MUCL 33604 TaxID=933084 RepID=A0A067Q0S2_9AGAM|nr:hypothetical protein JAAARDRAFT_35689 [Jaapia argillacea MUCL 33604]